MLTEKKKKYYRELLVARLNALLDEAINVVGSISELKHESPDPLDRATLEADRNFILRVRQREGVQPEVEIFDPDALR